MGNHSIWKLESKHIQRLKDEWIPAAEENENLPTTSFVKAVSWAEDVISGDANTEAEVYGVFCGEGHIHAIFDRVAIRPALPRSFKIISMVVAPHLDLGGMDKERFFDARQHFAEVVADVIVYGITLLNEHEYATKVKFFASDRVTLTLFRNVWGSFDQEALEKLDLETSVYGNWAEFTKIM